MSKAGCRSIVGPTGVVQFDEAAVMWAAFYQVMFKENRSRMTSASIELALTRLQDAFQVPMTYLQRTSTSPYWKRIPLA
jgi:hypothetical protein